MHVIYASFGVLELLTVLS